MYIGRLKNKENLLLKKSPQLTYKISEKFNKNKLLRLLYYSLGIAYDKFDIEKSKTELQKKVL